MSDTLINPPWYRKAFTWALTPSPGRKAVLVVIGLVLLIGGVLLAIDRCGTWRSDRDIEKRKANINAVLANIEIKETTIANLQTQVELEKQAANTEMKQLLENINATEATKVETNAALANLDRAKNANTTNSSVKQLEELLEKLR